MKKLFSIEEMVELIQDKKEAKKLNKMFVKKRPMKKKKDKNG